LILLLYLCTIVINWLYENKDIYIAKPVTLETILMWSRNKPSDWLSTQSENDKSEILNRAQQDGFTFLFNS
jgi:hypothetical protein